MTAPPLAVLASGEGTNLQALLDTVHGREVDIVAVGSDQPAARALDTVHGREARVVAVASDTPGCRALERAQAAGVPARAFPRADFAGREARDEAIAAWLRERGAEAVVLAGYMALLSPDFVRAFRDRILNVHPSLLPAFPGLHAIEQALDHGVKVFGVTVHLVDEGVDTGPIVLQEAVELPDARDPAEVLAALRPLEHTLLPQAVRLLAAGAVRRDPERPRRLIVAQPARWAPEDSSS